MSTQFCKFAKLCPQNVWPGYHHVGRFLYKYRANLALEILKMWPKMLKCYRNASNYPKLYTNVVLAWFYGIESK
jgi:hypothetical protein